MTKDLTRFQPRVRDNFVLPIHTLNPMETAPGGILIHHQGPVAGTPDSDLYSGERFGNFSYALPVAPGKHSVTLRFAENYFGTDGPG
jgi:hypothetical protein